MLKKKICAGTLALALSCQLVLTPVAMANLADDTLNALKSDAKYQEVVNKLTSTNEVNADDVDNFVRDVVNQLDGQQITNDNIKKAAEEAISGNSGMLKAVIKSFTAEDIENAKNGKLPSSLETLGQLFKDQLTKEGSTATGGGGGGGGGSTSGNVNDNTGKTDQVDDKGTGPTGDQTETTPALKKFNDLAGHWAAGDIEYMAAKGYVNGVAQGVFAPQAQVTRAEFAAMLVNVLGITETGTVPFKDVIKDSWYYASVAKAYQAGLVKGKSSDLFAPQAVITRQEMAAMICNAIRYQGKQVKGDVSALNIFTDNAKIADWARASAAEAYTMKIIKGKPDGNGLAFAPLDNATRAEAVVMLKNLLETVK